MSVDYDDENLKSDSDIIYPDYIEYARITCGNENSYFMKTEKITIGRNSADGTVDIDVGPHTFVSRKHLEMMYSYKKLKIKCLGKNGIFIDNFFRAHSSVPYELPYECTLRFPSTNVEVNVLQLVGRRATAPESPPPVVTGRKRKASQRAACNKIDSDDEMDTDPTNERDHHGNGSGLGNCDYQSERSVPLNRFGASPRRSFAEPKRKLSIASTQSKSDPIVVHQSGTNIISDNSNINRKSSVSLTMSEQPVITNTSHNPSKQVQQQVCCIEKTNASIPQIILNPRSYRSYSYNGDVIYTHNSQVFGSIYDTKDLAIEYGTDTQKPPYSYAQLIVQAVSSSRDRQLTLNGIYNYISKHYPYFKSHDKGWQNSVRHNLSLNRYFIKVPRGQDEPGKGSFWRVDGAYESKLIAQAFRKRRLRSNNCGSINGDNIQSASRLFSISGGRASNICTVTDRNSKLNNIFTLRRSDQKTPTTFVFRKMGGSQSATESLFGSANVINKQHDLSKNINMISTENVFHTTKSLPGKPSQKRVFQSPISIVSSSTPSSIPTNHNNGNNNGASTLITIGGKVFSTSKLKPIQLLTSNSSASLTHLKSQPQQQHQLQQQRNKYILISASQIDGQNSNSNQSVSITGSGTLIRDNIDISTTSSVTTNKILDRHLTVPVSSPDTQTESIQRFDSYQTLSPLSASETCEFAIDEPSQLDSSSTELGPLSPSIPLAHALHHTDEDALDLEMDQFQFLDSFSMLEYHNNGIASPPGDIEYRDDIDDYCVWQDESLGLQDVEIEIH